MTKLPPATRRVLDYLQEKGDASTRDALLDISINSGSFTKRISELTRLGHQIAGVFLSHPTTGQRYKRYTYNGGPLAKPSRY
jgi:hypothetical protein